MHPFVLWGDQRRGSRTIQGLRAAFWGVLALILQIGVTWIAGASGIAPKPSVELTFVNGVWCRNGFPYTGMRAEGVQVGRPGQQESETEYVEGVAIRYAEFGFPSPLGGFKHAGYKTHERFLDGQSQCLWEVWYQANGRPSRETIFDEGGRVILEREWNLQGTMKTLSSASLTLRGLAAPREADWGFSWRRDPAKLTIASVRPASAAAEATFAPGDEILGIDGRPTPSADAFSREVGKVQGGRSVKVTIRRQGQAVVLGFVRPPPVHSLLDALPEGLREGYLKSRPLALDDPRLRFVMKGGDGFVWGGYLTLFGFPYAGRVLFNTKIGYRCWEYREGLPAGEAYNSDPEGGPDSSSRM